MGILPEYIQSLADLVLQTYKGHITIAPRPTLIDYRDLLKDVPLSYHDTALQHTYALTISRISHIRSFYGIEREFDRYYLRLKQKLHCQMNLRHDKDLIKYQINKTLIEKQQSEMAELKLTSTIEQHQNTHTGLSINLGGDKIFPKALESNINFDEMYPEIQTKSFKNLKSKKQ